MAEYMSELQRIQTQVNEYDKDKKKFENVIDLIEEGSHYSDSMIECLKDYEVKLEKLEEKRSELKVLTQVANQNGEEMKNLRNSIELVRQQRDRMKQIIKSDIFPPEYPNLPIQDPRSKQLHEVHHEPDLPVGDASKHQKATKEESRQVTELRQEIELLKQRLDEKESKYRVYTGFNQPTNYFEDRFMRESLPPAKDNTERTPDNYMQSTNPVPKLLNLKKKNSADFSALGTPSHEGLKQLSPNNDLDHNPTFTYQHNSSLASKRQGRRKYGFMTQINTDSDQIFQNEERKEEEKGVYAGNEDYVYDLNEDNIKASLRTTKRHNKRKTKKSPQSEEKEGNCDEICAGAAYLVRLLRGFFGTKKDPVVRQW